MRALRPPPSRGKGLQGGERSSQGRSPRSAPAGALGRAPPLRGSAPLPGSRRAPETGEATPEVLVRAGRGKGGGTRGVAAAAGRSLGRRRHLVPEPPPPTQNAPGARPPLLHRAERAGKGAGLRHAGHASRNTAPITALIWRPALQPGAVIGWSVGVFMRTATFRQSGRKRAEEADVPSLVLKGAGGGSGRGLSRGFFAVSALLTQPWVLRHREVRGRDRGWSWVSHH